jgi:hypothetical protein
MINRGAVLISRLAVLFAVLLAVTACGGGGGGGSFYTGTDDENSISFALYDPQGNSTNFVTSSAPGTLKVSLRKGGGNIVVSAETDIGTLFPATGTALTDGNGVATFQLEAGEEKGAGTLTATATVDGEELTAFFTFNVGDSGLRMGYFNSDGTFIENEIFIEPESTLAAGGNAQFSVVVLNADGNRVSTAEEVRFSSGCIAGGLATINPTIAKTVNGQASTLYTATGCEGTDEITASLQGAATQAFGTISIASRVTNAVNFVSADPLLIVLRGTGGQNRDETSDVVFKVVDGTGNPLPGVNVEFSLSTYVGGLALSKSSALSDGNGEALVTVQAGDVATVARVLATVKDANGNEVATVSDLITVTTGLPDQNSISLAIGECDGENSFVVDGAMGIDGLCRTLTVSMADKFNNPVVDGTAAVFTTEYGSIVGSCTTVAGICSVEWTSQEPRFPTLTYQDYVVSFFDNQGVRCPGHSGNAVPCLQDLGEIRGGRSTILVHAIGEESFIDQNGNGVMDQSEQNMFQNMPEAFLDNNEDGVFTPALPQCLAAPMGSLQCISGQEEIFVDFNSNEAYDLNNDPAVYNGLLCPVEGNGVWCSRELINVRARHIVTLGYAPNWVFLLVGQTVLISDIYNNPPPAGATVNLTTEGNCEVVGPDSFEVLNYVIERGNGAFPVALNVTFEPGTPAVVDPPTPAIPPEPGSITVTLTTPESTDFRTYDCH